MPASFSSHTSWPRLTRSPAAGGTSATRPSRVLVSLGTPIRIAVLRYGHENAARKACALAAAHGLVVCVAPVRLVLPGRHRHSMRPAELSRRRPQNPFNYTYDDFEALPPVDPRLRPRRLDRSGLCRARQPEAGTHHRHGAGRPADDDDRSGQLARRRARTD